MGSLVESIALQVASSVMTLNVAPGQAQGRVSVRWPRDHQDDRPAKGNESFLYTGRPNPFSMLDQPRGTNLCNCEYTIKSAKKSLWVTLLSLRHIK